MQACTELLKQSSLSMELHRLENLLKFVFCMECLPGNFVNIQAYIKQNEQIFFYHWYVSSLSFGPKPNLGKNLVACRYLSVFRTVKKLSFNRYNGFLDCKAITLSKARESQYFYALHERSLGPSTRPVGYFGNHVSHVSHWFHNPRQQGFTQKYIYR